MLRQSLPLVLLSLFTATPTARAQGQRAEPIAYQVWFADHASHSQPDLPPDTRPEAPSASESIPAPRQGMSLLDLESLAEERHPTLAQAAAQVRAARGAWLQAGLYPNPTLGYANSEVGNDGRGGMHGLYVGQEFVTAGKLRLAQNAASQQVRQAEQYLAAQRLRVLNDVRSTYYDVLAAQRMVDLSAELLRIGNEGARTAEKLFPAEGSKIDLLQAKIEAETAQIQLQRARNRHHAAWRRLTAVAGVPDLPLASVAGTLEADLPQLDWEDSLRRLLSDSPELAAALFEVHRARWALARANVEPIPNLELQTSTQFDFATNYSVANVQATLPVPVFNKNQGNIRRAQAELTAARSEVARLELELQHRLAAAFQRYQDARVQVDRYGQVILPHAQESLKLTSSAYAQGEFNYLTLLTAQRTYFQTNLAYLEALRELRQSIVAIDGLLLTESLQPPRR